MTDTLTVHVGKGPHDIIGRMYSHELTHWVELLGNLDKKQHKFLFFPCTVQKFNISVAGCRYFHNIKM